LTEADRSTIVSEHTAGQTTIVDLAERYSVSDYSVRMVLRQAGVLPRRRTITEEQIA
jgi:Mor family transcriptional regulator